MYCMRRWSSSQWFGFKGWALSFTIQDVSQGARNLLKYVTFKLTCKLDRWHRIWRRLISSHPSSGEDPSSFWLRTSKETLFFSSRSALRRPFLSTIERFSWLVHRKLKIVLSVCSWNELNGPVICSAQKYFRPLANIYGLWQCIQISNLNPKWTLEVS